MELDPVVSYTLIPPDDDGEKREERVEPHLTVLPMERRRRLAEAAPASVDETGERPIRVIDQDATVLPPRGRRARVELDDDDEPETQRRRRRIPLVVTIGLLAIVLGIAVLAFTAMRALNSTVAVTPGAVTPAADVPAPPPAEDSAGPGVLALPDSGAAAGSAAANQSGGDATATPAAAAASDTPPPLPRLRPTTDADNATPPAATASAPPVAAPVAAAPAPSPSTAVAPATATAAPTAPSSDSDVDALMNDVNKILAAPPPAATASPPPADVAAGSAPTSGAASGQSAGAQDYPPLPPTTRHGWFADDSGAIPVPPADIPDAEAAPGQ